MGLEEFKRVTDLFTEGEEVVLDAETPTLVWVQKLNSFEREEAQRDGQAARARVIVALKDLQSDEYAIFDANLQSMDDDSIREALVNGKGNDHLIAAVESMRTDPEWKDRLEGRTRVSDDMSDEEKAAVAKLNADYADEVARRVEGRRAGYLLELQNTMQSTQLKDAYREQWLEQRSFSAYQREYVKTQVYFSVRVCKAIKAGDQWDHSACDSHRKRALDSRAEVPQLPDRLLQLLSAASNRVQVNGRDARFSGALASSSGSSAQPSEPVESTPSTPVETSPALATTS